MTCAEAKAIINRLQCHAWRKLGARERRFVDGMSNRVHNWKLEPLEKQASWLMELDGLVLKR